MEQGVSLTDRGLTYLVAKSVVRQLVDREVLYAFDAEAAQEVAECCEGLAGVIRMSRGSGYTPTVVVVTNEEAAAIEAGRAVVSVSARENLGE